MVSRVVRIPDDADICYCLCAIGLSLPLHMRDSKSINKNKLFFFSSHLLFDVYKLILFFPASISELAVCCRWLSSSNIKTCTNTNTLHFISAIVFVMIMGFVWLLLLQTAERRSKKGEQKSK